MSRLLSGRSRLTRVMGNERRPDAPSVWSRGSTEADTDAASKSCANREETISDDRNTTRDKNYEIENKKENYESRMRSCIEPGYSTSSLLGRSRKRHDLLYYGLDSPKS